MGPGRLSPRAVGLAVLATSGALLVGGCSLPGSGPDAQKALAGLASHLSSGKLLTTDLSGGAASVKAYQAVVAGMPRPRVAAASTSAHGSTASGRLVWTWTLGGHAWSYRSTVTMAQVKQGGTDVWQARWTPALVQSSLKADEHLAAISLTPQRGRILAGDGSAIVEPRPVLKVGVDRTGLADAAARTSAQRLAQLVGIDATAYAKQVVASGPQAFVQAIVYRRDQAPAKVLNQIAGIPGGRAVSDRLPLAPTKEFAAAILGTVGPATAELVTASHGRILAGDVVGLSGLQRRYDAQLFGKAGVTVDAVAPGGSRRPLFSAASAPGTDLRTTLDVGAQQLAEQVLAGVGPASALVAVQPSTGKLLAVADGPGAQGNDLADYARVAPGSTFKMVTSLALLRAGLTPDSPVSCPATTVVDGKQFKNYSDYPPSGLGTIPFRLALANSCNTAFIGQRAKVGPDALAQAAAALGFGVDHDLGFPAYFGQTGVTGGATETQTQSAASLIGQGTVLASPLAMATVMASILHGSAVVPQLLPDAKADPGSPPAHPLTAAEAASLRTMLRGVVEQGSGTILRGLPGGPVIAKTGTAEFGTTPPLPTHAWMVAGRGDLAVAVYVDRGSTGSGTAGPLLRRFLQSVRVP